MSDGCPGSWRVCVNGGAEPFNDGHWEGGGGPRGGTDDVNRPGGRDGGGGAAAARRAEC